MTDTRKPVPPIEGHYAMLRNGTVAPPLKIDDRGDIYFSNDIDLGWWHPSGRSYQGNFCHDIIATISPEAMEMAAEVSAIPTWREALEQLKGKGDV